MKKLLKFFKKFFLYFFGFLTLYGISVFILSKITINAEQNSAKDITIYIITNGVHTDIVVPIKNEIMDWSKEVKFSNTLSKDSSYNYLAMGWGDKGFYLETPTWAELKMSVAFKAATGLGSTAIHATFYNNLSPSETCKEIVISKDQYQRLVDYIMDSFLQTKDQHLINIKTEAHYNKYDSFYEAKGSYSMFHTCNTWANSGLKACGQKACLWTIFDSGIFDKYE